MNYSMARDTDFESNNDMSDNLAAMLCHKQMRVHLNTVCLYLCSDVFCLSIKVDKFEITGLIEDQFEIAGSSK